MGEKNLLSLLILGAGFSEAHSMRKSFIKTWIAALMLLELERVRVHKIIYGQDTILLCAKHSDLFFGVMRSRNGHSLAET